MSGNLTVTPKKKGQKASFSLENLTSYMYIFGIAKKNVQVVLQLLRLMNTKGYQQANDYEEGRLIYV
jgi:hypothetical protein